MFTSGTMRPRASITRLPLTTWFIDSEKSTSANTCLRSRPTSHSFTSFNLPAAYMPPMSAPIDVPATDVMS